MWSPSEKSLYSQHSQSRDNSTFSNNLHCTQQTIDRINIRYKESIYPNKAIQQSKYSTSYDRLEYFITPFVIFTYLSCFMYYLTCL